MTDTIHLAMPIHSVQKYAPKIIKTVFVVLHFSIRQLRTVVLTLLLLRKEVNRQKSVIMMFSILQGFPTVKLLSMHFKMMLVQEVPDMRMTNKTMKLVINHTRDITLILHLLVFRLILR